jgi:wobble nucleotide-excising tRNase
MSYIKVEGHSNLVRDSDTNAIINTNISEYEKYLILKEKKESSNKQITNMQLELEMLKDDVACIKNMLTILINKN